MLRTEFRDCTQRDVLEVLGDLRPADYDELLAAHGSTYITDVLQGFERASHAWTMRIGDRVAAVFGAVPVPVEAPLNVGAPWLLGTPALTGRGGRLVRRMPWYIEQLLNTYDVLTNWVDVRNTPAITWLAHMGFSFHETVAAGPLGMPFHRFQRSAASCAHLG